MSDVQDFKNEILKNSNLAFVLGNGINCHAYDNIKEKAEAIPWSSLVRWIWDYYFPGNQCCIRDDENGISLTELYDVICLNEDSAPTLQIKDSVRMYFTDNHLDIQEEYHKKLQSSLQKWNMPVLTTNFDLNIEQNLYKINVKHTDNNYQKGFSHYYPWNVVRSDALKASLPERLNNYGVWHINGMLNYKESIRLGLTDYMGQVERARKMINGMKKDGDAPFSVDYMGRWQGYNTWLHILFNRDLCIIGLSLDVNENFLRWLLIERQKYYKKFKDMGIKKCKGWYIYTSQDPELTAGKKLYLESVGLKPVKLNTYKEVYEDLLLL